MAKLRLQPALALSWLLAALVAPRVAGADTPAPAPSPTFTAPVAPIPQLTPPTLHVAATPIPLPSPSPRSRPIRAVPVIWYGWETLLTGAAAYVLPLALLKNSPETGLLLGAVFSPLTTMSMHMIHGEEVKAYLSLPLSYAMVAGGGALAAKLECGPTSPKPCVANAVFTGMILGGISAVVLDAAALAWGPPASPQPVKKAVLWPSVAPLRGGVALGLGGTF